MGRYYNGDIEGKFWFAVQPTDAPTRFGGQVHEPQYVSFAFTEDDLPTCQAELDKIENSPNFAKTKEFFDKLEGGYNNDMLEEAGITREDVKDYADWELGKKIEDCLQQNGECHFDGEL